ncbi:DUF2058 domain-containing protein [Photobacterium leiognathi]|uniref:Nucleoprotein/polynucleotide-associated enzyme n=3 Tax=Photobacterium leiognathi TaxID=553611 RepID=V5F6Y5_PHOLE|nr:DUF2058 domain-containing protein [Photobacterium leiognathi]KJF90475.1 hypothetical protein UB42_07830 [Photobacterium leiognathi]MCG3885413.1 DUF2058 domain-containing protein [Photobacterium leiognathi]PHZ60349.1 DUF2058 domain-containing protein [Photobacterium leiognathi]PSV04279.1 DUF2058 domain-containing protein [Photobacterium leiognathi subsp. mandapamensis]PSV11849.1 DUF2058 domain-containing protein [Photobacterium leiognathi subsp. mandapamensis]
MAKLSLQEQMLQAGLIDKKKLKKAGKSSKKSRTQAKEAKAAVEANRQAQLEKDKELNRARDEEAKAKELASQIKQLIEMNRLDRKEGDIGYNFTDGSTVKKIYVDKTMQDQLVNGRLAIARYQDGYEVIPAGVADKIALRDEQSIVVNNTVDESIVDEDDPYADFVIPDDLMW